MTSDPFARLRARSAASSAVALIAVGLLLRLGFLGADSFWQDEAYSVAVVQQHSARQVWEGSVDPNHPPLYFLVLKGALQIGGASEAVARLPSALASVCSLGLLFILARRLGASRRTATAALVLLALAPVDIWYAQDARMYAMVTATALAFAIALTSCSWTGALAAGATLALGLYVDFTMAPLSMALVSLWTVRWWRTGRRPHDLTFVAGAVVLGWLLFKPRWAHLGQVLDRIDTVPLFVRLNEVLGVRLPAGAAAVVVVLLLVILTGAAAALIMRTLASPRGRTYWEWIAWSGFVAATALTAIPRGYSLKQFLVTGWPFVVLFVAWMLTDTERVSRTRVAATPLARHRLAIATGMSLVAAIVTVATPRADWRAAVAYLNGRTAVTEVVWLDPPWNIYAYECYRPAVNAVPSPMLTAAGPPPGSPRHICIVAERFGRTPPTSVTEAWLDRHSELADVMQFARLEVRCYVTRSR